MSTLFNAAGNIVANFKTIIANGWVTSARIAAGAVGTSQLAAGVTLTTPILGAATGTSLAVTGALTSSGGGIGYATGSGGTVVQSSSKTTGVTLNKLCGQITTASGAMTTLQKQVFVVTNSTVAATDGVSVWVPSGGTANAYRVDVVGVLAGSFSVCIENITGGTLTEAPLVSFAVIKAVIA